jgi:Type I phosphodiesterase / nucleotide pyrophosphatase
MRRMLSVVLLLSLACCEQRATNAHSAKPLQHVLMISIDGLHQLDLEHYIARRPQSQLAKLAALGARYTHALAAFPSDSFPAVLAWATGGTPRSTGVDYDVSYDRTLSPHDSDCSSQGTQVDFSDAADQNSAAIDGGGGLDVDKLPRDPARGCAPVYPHDYLRVNTIFEVVAQAGLRSAWSDKHLSYEILNGPSGTGVDDLFVPEIAVVDTDDAAATRAYDQSKVAAVLNQMHGLDSAGERASVPALFGMNFQAVSVTQKSVRYLDAQGTPSVALLDALDGVDAQLATLVAALHSENLWSSTLLVVAASHGQSPIDPSLVRRLPTHLIPGLVADIGSRLLAAATQDAVSLLWLSDPSKTDAVAEHIMANADAAGVERLMRGSELNARFGDPTQDARAPDLVVVVQTGVIYTDANKKVAEHGGFSDDDRRVALMLVDGSGSGSARPGRLISDEVETRQLAPTILSALGLAPDQLQALASEPTTVLPGFE